MNPVLGFVELFENTRYVNMMTATLAILAIIISVVSLVQSGRANRNSHRTNSRLVEIEEGRDRLASKQAAKAQLSAVRIYESNYYKIIVSNSGSDARNIRILVDGVPILQHPSLAPNQEERKRLGTGSSFYYRFVAVPTANKPKTVTMTWEDDSGEESSTETDL